MVTMSMSPDDATMPEHRTSLPPKSRRGPVQLPKTSPPVPRHVPRRQSRALPIVDIQERGFRETSRSNLNQGA